MNSPASEIYENLKLLEIEVEKSLQIIPGFLVIINVNRFNSILSKIYSSIPQEIKDARDFLNKNEKSVYNYLKNFEIILINSFQAFPNFLAVVKIKELEKTIDYIYASLPQEIQEAREYLGIQ